MIKAVSLRETCTEKFDLSQAAEAILQTPATFLGLYGEVNSVKKDNYKIWLNDGVY